MKRFYQLAVIAALITLTSQVALAADYTIDPTHSSVSFTIRHLVSKVTGQFKDFEGTFSFDAKAAASAQATVSIKTASISTDNDKRDTHLKSADFFDVKKFPTITFKSKKITADGEGKYKLVGDVTMHGVTREETFAIDFGGTVKDPWGNNRAGFTATTKLNRKNYGIIWNKTLDNGGYMLGDDVDVVLQVEGIEKAAAKK
jgi:polyisoprenoid-binding protein YceI